MNSLLTYKYLHFQVPLQGNSKAMSLKLIFFPNKLPRPPVLCLWSVPSLQLYATAFKSTFFLTVSAWSPACGLSCLRWSFHQTTRLKVPKCKSDHGSPCLEIFQRLLIFCGRDIHTWLILKITTEFFKCIDHRAWGHTYWVQLSIHTHIHICVFKALQIWRPLSNLVCRDKTLHHWILIYHPSTCQL